MSQIVKRILPGLLLLIGLHPLWGAGLVASAPVGNDGPADEALRKEVSDALHLTPDQQTRLEAIQLDYRTRLDVLGAALQDKRLDLQRRLRDPKGDLDLIRKVHQELKALTTSLMDLRLDSQLGIRAILTPEQKIILEELFQKRIPDHAPTVGTEDGGPDGTGQ